VIFQVIEFDGAAFKETGLCPARVKERAEVNHYSLTLADVHKIHQRMAQVEVRRPNNYFRILPIREESQQIGDVR